MRAPPALTMALIALMNSLATPQLTFLPPGARVAVMVARE
jgi:hypothetical protein